MAILALSLLLGVASASSSLHPRQASDNSFLYVPGSAWSALNEQISGGLHAGQPYGLPCFETYKNSTGTFPNKAEPGRCDTIQNSLAVSDSLVEEFGSYHSPSFGTCMATGEKCTLSPNVAENPMKGTCYQGSVPEYYVDARNVEDIQAALKFADEYNLPITIKNTGHDYKGRSAAPGTFGIWTHHIRPDIVLDEEFFPEGCGESAGPVVTYGAGQMWAGVYDFLAGSGYLIVAGTCPTVGAAGGWIQGGGHSPFTPSYGLGVDNSIQMKVVLPNGTYITTNRCQNQDIFFALRGGGGGTFGVVTEVTTKLHNDTSFTFASLGMTVPGDTRKITEIFVDNAVKWAEEGWGGFIGVSDTNVVNFIAITSEITVEEAKESLRPVYEFFESVGGAFRNNITSLPTQNSFEKTPEAAAFVQEDIGVQIAQASRLIPKENFETEGSRKALVDVLVQRQFGALLAAPTRYELPESDKPGNPGHSAVTPSWRNALWHLVYQNTFDPVDAEATKPEKVAATFLDVSTDMDRLRAITPSGGAYMNEGDTYEPDPIRSYWGQENYDRLLKIKKDIDPKNLLSCFKCVGWKETDARHKCYPGLGR